MRCTQKKNGRVGNSNREQNPTVRGGHDSGERSSSRLEKITIGNVKRGEGNKTKRDPGRPMGTSQGRDPEASVEEKPQKKR